MAKVLLVEDDNNLREIYEARLQAEGYDIVSAMNGEEALVVAKKERPDLIISDVMMPRISGFEMLDILRNTEGLRDVRIIMLTALGQAEDKTRADQLGADRYLVKSQVTLEDIVKAVQELLAPPDATPPVTPETAAPPAAAAAPVATPTDTPATPAPAAPATTPPAVDTPAVTPVVSPAPGVPATPAPSAAPAVPPSTPQAEPAIPIVTPAEPAAVPAPAVPDTTIPPAVTEPAVPPATDSAAPVQAANVAEAHPQSASAEVQAVEEQIKDFVNQPAPAAPVSPDPAAVTSAAPGMLPGQPGLITPETAAPPAAVAPPVPAPVQAPTPTIPVVAPTNPATAEPMAPEPAAVAPPAPAPVATPEQVSAPSQNSVMTDAINDLVSSAQQPAPAPAEPKVITPPSAQAPFVPPSEPAAAAPAAPAVSMPDAPTVDPAPAAPPAAPVAPTPDVIPDANTQGEPVGITHKKVISPISGPDATQPTDLNQLLANEGITSFDEPTVPAPAPMPVAPAPAPAPMEQPAPAAPQPLAPAPMPSQPQPGIPDTNPAPHPPGQVISPDGGSDPNRIAL